ncbi:MAG: hypothetical protein IKE43_06100 [Coriobacteriales bacterium]|nr:hypothetical protein [Coriobacteriales bacterium]
MNYKICPNCNRSVSEYAIKCPSCGSYLTDDTVSDDHHKTEYKQDELTAGLDSLYNIKNNRLTETTDKINESDNLNIDNQSASNTISIGTTKDNAASGCSIGCGIIIALIILLFIGYCSIGGGTYTSDAKAYAIAESFIEDHLVSPSSAKFAPMPQATIENNGDSPIHDNYTRFTVKSYVDSQNRFGATIRTYFTVVIDISRTDDRYYIIDYQIE